MLPGKARSVPVPNKFLISEVQKAIPTPYHGPKNTAERTFTMCWIGKHFDPPTGIENVESTTASATNIPDNTSFTTDSFFILKSPP
jgi:hypothetical protein